MLPPVFNHKTLGDIFNCNFLQLPLHQICPFFFAILSSTITIIQIYHNTAII
uniref:Uncharacterized protein n=1 Tax=Rhizophora mucronata TaxID=61149 RepID=A0A2P2IV58_RHIMU